MDGSRSFCEIQVLHVLYIYIYGLVNKAYNLKISKNDPINILVS